ncbi:hypothetical protein F5B20DRAFT_521464 [Whalleya microplaca]|nr:hypothetical protein F5B20DRAFT_521464 [Whalleya microplaca]
MDTTLGMPMHVAVLRITALCYYLVFGSVGDAVLVFAWFIWRRRGVVFRFLESQHFRTLVQVAAITALVLALFKLILRLGQTVKTTEWNGPGRPLLFPCQTTHTRLFPKKHSFDYSYLLVGVPVGWTGVAGGMVSSEVRDPTEKGWFVVDPADYLERGSGHLGLRGKLDAYLDSQGVDGSRYPYAYLLTAAKFCGYHFNPVSFWCLYDADKQFAATILEVNNTFDERRMYYLTPNDNASASIEASENDGTSTTTGHKSNGHTPKPLRQTWPKDFHVSPFNSRKGAYSLVAHDPLLPNMEGKGLVNTTINLISSKDHAKLVARIFSEGDAIDPTEMTMFQKFRFIASWWWVGFVTFPRIVKEAAILFFKRKLHVWYRPEPLKSNIGRRADETERKLESIFRQYLRFLVGQSQAPLVVRYVPSGVADVLPETMTSDSARTDSSSTEEVVFKVLTPVFYSRFVYYAHDFEAMFSELNDSSTIWVSTPELLPKLVFKKPPPPLYTASYLDYGYFTAIKNLRRIPERIERPMTSSQTTSTHTQKDIRGFRLSSMDGYVLANADSQTRELYRQLVFKLFIADRIAMGSVDILSLEHWAIRLLLAWVVVS